MATDVVLPDGSVRTTIKGDLFRIAEWYGWTGTANTGLRMLNTKISEGIIKREIAWGIYGKLSIDSSVADAAIYGNGTGTEFSIAQDMAKDVIISGKRYKGVQFNEYLSKKIKGPGSRINGWEKMRVAIANAQAEELGWPREYPGLFVFRNCQDGFIRICANNTSG